MKIFISHINEEAGLAQVLKDWVESTFGDTCSVFVRSFAADESSSDEQLDGIEQGLSDADAMLVLCSPRSLSLPLIHFEAGCGWIKKVSIIVLCHSGQTPESLPPPLSGFQSLHLHDAASCERFMQSLAKEVGRSRLPRISYQDMAQEIHSAHQGADAVEESLPEPAVEPTQEPPPPKAPSAEVQLKEVEVQLLKTIGRLQMDSCTVDYLARLLEKSHKKIEHSLNHLVNECKMLSRHAHFRAEIPTRYSLSSKGRTYLTKRNLV